MDHRIMNSIKHTLTKLLPIAALIYMPFSSNALAAIHGTATLQELRFGIVIPITGQCEMNFNTGAFTSDFNNTCPDKLGSPGQYKIRADKNTLVRITPYTFTYAGNLFTFTPSGEVSNGIETKILNANNATIIDSGPTGLIDMKIGGNLNVALPLTTSNSYIVDLEIDIIENP